MLKYKIPQIVTLTPDNHIHNKIHEYLFLGIKPKIITINRYYQYVFL